MTRQRRDFVRIPNAVHATYTVLGRHNPHNSLTRDTGGGGIGFFTHSYMSPGTILQVELRFPGRKIPVHFTAKVAWSGKLFMQSFDDVIRPPQAFITGVTFLDISPENQALLIDYSSSQAAH